MNKILIIYYSQTGQLKSVLDSIASELLNDDNIQISFFEIQPTIPYPFPWPSDDFFNVMPESVMGIPTQIHLKELPLNENFDLIILAYQVWFLSISIPVNSFLLALEAKKLFKGKKVITILGVRNMWVMAHEQMKIKLQQLGAEHVGNIVLCDKNPNLISVITIIKWLMHGNKGPHRFLPQAGISEKDIEQSKRFATPIRKAVCSSNYTNLQSELIDLGAVQINFSIMQSEQKAHKIFQKFAKYILKKGHPENKKRLLRVRLFKYYLLFAIFIILPLASVVFNIYGILFRKKAKATKMKYQNLAF